MRTLLAILLTVTFWVPAAQASAVAAPRAKASDSAKAAFIKKCFRHRTKDACTAPPDARVAKK